jgi:hypothetical protein
MLPEGDRQCGALPPIAQAASASGGKDIMMLGILRLSVEKPWG